VQLEGLGKLKKSNHRESNPRPSGLYIVPQSTTLPCASDNISNRQELIPCIQVEEYLYLALYTKIYHLLITVWISLLKLRVAQLVKKFPTFHGTQIFTTVCLQNTGNLLPDHMASYSRRQYHEEYLDLRVEIRIKPS
jgi:hypothetical protein